jgi:hypothetical protein
MSDIRRASVRLHIPKNAELSPSLVIGQFLSVERAPEFHADSFSDGFDYGIEQGLAGLIDVAKKRKSGLSASDLKELLRRWKAASRREKAKSA